MKTWKYVEIGIDYNTFLRFLVFKNKTKFRGNLWNTAKKKKKEEEREEWKSTLSLHFVNK